jgi:hypothetical protein
MCSTTALNVSHIDWQVRRQVVSVAGLIECPPAPMIVYDAHYNVSYAPPFVFGVVNVTMNLASGAIVIDCRKPTLMPWT